MAPETVNAPTIITVFKDAVLFSSILLPAWPSPNIFCAKMIQDNEGITKSKPNRFPEVIRHPVICAQPAGNKISHPQSNDKGIRGMYMAPCRNTKTTAIMKLSPNFANMNGNPTDCMMPKIDKMINILLYCSVFSIQRPSNAALMMPTTIIIAARQLTSSGVKPQQSNMLSRIDPYILNDPSTVPNAQISVRNFLSLNNFLIAVKYSVFSTQEPAEAGVGGLSLNQRRTHIAGIRVRPNQNKSNTVNYDWILSLESLSTTKRGGRMKPAAVPIMLATDRMAKETERYIRKTSTFYFKNHRTAIFVGALRMNG